MDQEFSSMPEGERLVLCRGQTGHVGRRREVTGRVHGSWDVGERNEEGERVVDLAMTFDMATCNTLFHKNEPIYDLQEWKKEKSGKIFRVFAE